MNRPAPDFLDGGGEMGERMRRFDWSPTGLGPPSAWPQSLKTIVRVMLDSRFAMWMSWGPEGTFFCNDAYLPTVGIKRDWVLGARSDRVWEEIWHDIGPRIEQVLTTGRATWDQALLLFLRRSGYDEETFHTFSYSPVYDESSRVAGMLCVVVEETERVIGERRLKMLSDLASVSTSEATTMAQVGRLMLEALAPGRFDVPFAALYLADATTRGAHIVGATTAPRAGRTPELATDDDDPWKVLTTIETNTEQLIDPPAHQVAIDGPWQEPIREALVVPLSDSRQARPFGCVVLGVSTRRQLDGGYRSFLSLVARQIASQLADAQTRLEAQQRVEALAELDRAKNLFFSNVSHEFRTPLTLLLGPIDNLLAKGHLPPDVTDSLTLAQRNGARLRKLVNSLLDFSKIEAGQVDTNFQATDLAVLTQDLAAVFRAAAEEAGLRLIVRCEPAAILAYVDRDMWEKVVLNLLSNALKFTFDGEIEVALSTADSHARLLVRDTGVGIDAAALPKIFERFHRVAGARSRSQEGTGIGLALVRELVKLHGGTVSASSEVGQGTSLLVRIPLGKAHLPSDRIDAFDTASVPRSDRTAFLEDALRTQQSSYRRPSAAEGRIHDTSRVGRMQGHVLIVDDNADMRAYIRRLLEPYWTVRTAADGNEALALIGQSVPDLVVTDMMMPHLDGRGLIEHLRATPATQFLPVIVLSAQAGDEARVAGLRQGADDYLVKPFSAPELLARVEVQLMRARLRRVEELRNKRLADVFRDAPVGVAMLRGPDHIFEFANAMYLEFVGGRPLLGLPLRDALPELRGQGAIELLDTAYATREPYRGHAFPVRVLESRSGQLTQRYFEFVYQPLADEGDHEAGIAVVGVDVTELIEARMAAEDASRTKDEFIAVLGHELRNPLAPIVTALQLMKMRAPDVSVREREIIERQIRHMGRLVDDLLDVSRITRGNLELRRVALELSTVVDRAIEIASPLLEARRQVLEIDVSRFGLPVLADSTRLCQVIGNLLTNSSKFTEAGGHISLSARVDGGEIVVSVADSGIGMTADELESVFELFVQGAQEMHRPQGGLGLGLTIARNLARLHGGSLSASSAGPGKGSEFTLRLPCLPVEANETTDVGSADGLGIPVATAKRRVLLVDDSPDAAYALEELLREFGYDVMIALDGPSALRLVAENEPFDVALLDIGLPVMNGYELAQHLRSSDAGRALRLIALTGYGQAGDMAKTKRFGFDLHLVKPVDIDALLLALEAHEQ